jgi:hypothetical protein
MAKKTKVQRMTELLEKIALTNELLFDLHHIPILKIINKKIAKELSREK